jgi:hypothetical protein
MTIYVMRGDNAVFKVNQVGPFRLVRYVTPTKVRWDDRSGRARGFVRKGLILTWGQEARTPLIRDLNRIDARLAED